MAKLAPTIRSQMFAVFLIGTRYTRGCVGVIRYNTDLGRCLPNPGSVRLAVCVDAGRRRAVDPDSEGRVRRAADAAAQRTVETPGGEGDGRPVEVDHRCDIGMLSSAMSSIYP